METQLTKFAFQSIPFINVLVISNWHHAACSCDFDITFLNITP